MLAKVVYLDFTKTIIPFALMASESIAIDSESIQARGIIVNYNILHLSRGHGDRWGAIDQATLSLRLILFSDFLGAFQDFNPDPVHSEMLFS